MVPKFRKCSRSKRAERISVGRQTFFFFFVNDLKIPKSGFQNTRVVLVKTGHDGGPNFTHGILRAVYHEILEMVNILLLTSTLPIAPGNKNSVFGPFPTFK